MSHRRPHFTLIPNQYQESLTGLCVAFVNMILLPVVTARDCLTKLAAVIRPDGVIDRHLRRIALVTVLCR